jgi:hypothetical protein
MTVVARRFASTPARTAAETWEQITDLIAGVGSTARQDLQAVGGVAASIIADEIPQQAPIVVMGNGPRLRVYCVYGDSAVTGDDCDEQELAWTPTESDWKMFLPCAEEDLEWVRNALQSRSKKVFAYEAEKGVIPELESETEGSSNAILSVNIKEFLRK